MGVGERKRRNVLVLEDEAIIAISLEDELVALGIHVVGPASNPKSALWLAEKADLDGALLDLSINGAYATEVADALHVRGIPYVFMTAFENPGGLRHRDAIILRKPFTPIGLRAALADLFN